ncbi:MAG: response regulator transcription factor [Gemmatimonadota bacterium]
MPRVLIVEDEDLMATALTDAFKHQGYEVELARDGPEALRLAGETGPDLILLDAMLPKMSGPDVCRGIRRQGNRVPIIMLAARGQEIDKLLRLKLGADDYVTKPFSFLGLMARVEAVLQRSSGAPIGLESYRFGDVSADFRRGEVRKKGRMLEMTSRELRLLQYLVENRGRIVARDQLLDAVWGYGAAPLTRTVDMHVAKLRKKIEDEPAEPRFIVTVHGMGYKFTG